MNTLGAHVTMSTSSATILSGLFAILALAAPSVARADEPPAPPVAAPASPSLLPVPKGWPEFIPLSKAKGADLSAYGYRPAHRVNTGLAVGGGCMFGGAWLLSGLAGSVGLDSEGDGAGAWMFVPVVGPIAWGLSSGGSSVGNYFLFVDVLAQGAGITMFAIGMHGRDGWERPFTLTPMAFAGGGGVSAQGSF